MKDEKKKRNSLRLMAFVYIVLIFEFSQCRDAGKGAILSNFSKTIELKYKAYITCYVTKISMQCCWLDYSTVFRYDEITVLIFTVMFLTCTPVR